MAIAEIFRNMFRDLTQGGKKREAADIVYSSESAVVTSNLPIAEVMKNTYSHLKRNPYLEEAIGLLERGKQRNIAYRNILSTDMLSMLRSAENRQMPASDIFGKYINLKRAIDKANGKMRSALMKPTLTYILVSAMAYFAIRTFYSGFGGISWLDLSSVGTVKKMFFPVVIVPILTVHVMIKKFPYRVPYWSKVYGFIRSAGYLMVIKTLFDLGLSSADAIAIFKKLGDKRLSREIEKLKEHENNPVGLAKVLSYYLSPVEQALIKTSVQFANEQAVFSDIVDKRMEEIENTVTMTTAIFAEMVTMLSVFPVMMVGYVFVTIITLVSAGSASVR